MKGAFLDLIQQKKKARQKKRIADQIGNDKDSKFPPQNKASKVLKMLQDSNAGRRERVQVQGGLPVTLGTT